MLKVYEAPKEILPKEPEYFIALSEQGDVIVGHLVDKDGKHLPGGNLFTIDKRKGHINLFGYIGKRFGLDLHTDGCLKIIRHGVVKSPWTEVS